MTGGCVRILDLLHGNGIAVDLATATASPPPWLAGRTRRSARSTPRGTRMEIGSRQTWCPSSPVFREHSLSWSGGWRAGSADHPAVVDVACLQRIGQPQRQLLLRRQRARISARWLRGPVRRHRDAQPSRGAPLSGASTTRSSTRSARRRRAPRSAIPGSCWTGVDSVPTRCSTQYLAEKAVLREITPAIPVTTNFLVGTGPGEIGPGDCDYARWAPEQDIVSNDHYLIGLGTGEQAPRLHLEFSADLTRGLAGGRPWWLMEHSTSAVNWQRVNRAKAARRNGAELAGPPGPRRRRDLLLPVPAVGDRRREVPLGDASACRRGFAAVAGRMPTGGADRPAR